jgi:hypothetical protein
MTNHGLTNVQSRYLQMVFSKIRIEMYNLCFRVVKNEFILSSPGSTQVPQQEERIKLLLVMPATNAVSERSVSGLKCVKTYLRSTTGDSRH